MTDIWVLMSVGTDNIRICGTALTREDATAWSRSSRWHNAIKVPLDGIADGEIKPVPFEDEEPYEFDHSHKRPVDPCRGGDYCDEQCPGREFNCGRGI